MTAHPQVFILSVHYNEDFWVTVQRKYLDLHIDLPHERLFAAHGVDRTLFRPGDLLFDHSGDHATGLNMLSAEALRLATDNDWLIFLDSDAVPIRPMSSVLREDQPLIAVQRLDNLGDIQPHPSFCAVKAGLWTDMNPDWSSGYTWVNSAGATVTDVGAGVLKVLEETGTQWTPLIRRNRANYHFLRWGVYGRKSEPPVVYHHGAGSRGPSSRVNRMRKKDPEWRKKLRTLRFLALVLLFSRRGGLGVSVAGVLDRRSTFSQGLEAAIAENPDFWRAFY